MISQLGCPTSDDASDNQSDKSTSNESKQFSIVPLGLPKLPIPKDNPMTVEKVELGKLLYFDKRVSADGTISCATCHDQTKGWAEHEPTSEGIGHKFGKRNSPTIINSAYAPELFWDGRAKSLEEQAVGPVGNPIEMGNSMEAVVNKLNTIPGYVERFQEVFGTEVTEDGFAKAIAAFERTILSGDSPYDRYVEGDDKVLSAVQIEGLTLFEEIGCADCHKPPLFTTYEYVNVGVDAKRGRPDIGRQKVTSLKVDMGKFRIPSLRDVESTGPYFHDGSVNIIDEAVALMADGGRDNPNLDPKMLAMREAELSVEDQEKIVRFLNALSGKYPVIEPPEPLPETTPSE